MMEWTDRHCRYFHRLLTRRTRLYTEMVTTGALRHGDVPRHLDFDPSEHPLALQLGGSEPEDLAHCARLAERWGYDEVNLNCGCPSERVQRGAFGACLMAEPRLVADCVAAMRSAVGLPITVKHRIGIDRHESYDFVRDFVGTVAEGGCEVFIVHARNAWLKGLSPKENRELPPLRHAVVARLKDDFPAPDLRVERRHRLGRCDRGAPERSRRRDDRPARVSPPVGHDRVGCSASSAPTPQTADRDAIEATMVDYMERVARTGEPWTHVSRHILGLRHGEPGARRWRQVWSDPSIRALGPREVSRRARAAAVGVVARARRTRCVIARRGRTPSSNRSRETSMANRTLTLDDTLQAYLVAHSVREIPAQTELREATRTHPHAGMQIGPEQGQLMALLVRLIGARRCIEVGVFTGYSALTVALALPADGYLLACDVSDAYTRVGRPFWEAAGVAGKIDLRLGPARRHPRRLPRRRRGRALSTSPSSMPTSRATTPTTSAACSCCGRAA